MKKRSSQGSKKKPKGATGAGNPLLTPSRLLSEKIMHDIDRVLEGREFANIDEANAFLATLTGTGLQDALRNAAPPSAKEQAQELAFSAMDAQSEQEARELVQRALALDADCVDALVLKGDLEATTAREAIAALKKAVAAGERSLGAEFFRENKGDFLGNSGDAILHASAGRIGRTASLRGQHGAGHAALCRVAGVEPER